MVGAVPFTLHQQLKYIVNGNLVIIYAEQDHPLQVKGNIPMIRLDEAIELTSFQAFEVSPTNYRPFGTPSLKPMVPSKVISVAQEMTTKQF